MAINLKTYKNQKIFYQISIAKTGKKWKLE